MIEKSNQVDGFIQCYTKGINFPLHAKHTTNVMFCSNKNNI